VDQAISILMRGACKAIGSTVVLDNVDIEIRAGKTWIEGINGSGKSCLARALVGLLPLDQGSVQMHPNCRMGFAAAGRGLASGLTCEAQLLFASRQLGLESKAVERAVDEFGLNAFLKTSCKALSTGQGQRLRLALATLRPPDVLLLDEVHLGLDEEGKELAVRVGSRLVEEGGAIVWFGQHDSYLGTGLTSHFRLDTGRLHQVL